MDLRIRLGVSL